jgi:DNA-binding transcriptional LysR family regulator
LEIFESVARHRSFTRAAELLHLTQPSVSIQVKSLSEAIGHKLFHKIGRNVQLSDVGRELYDTCRDFSALWSNFESRVGEVGALKRGCLRISVVTTAKYFLPRALGIFCRRHPGIEVELDVQNRDGVLSRLRDNLDDLHIMSMPPTDWDIESEPFLANPLIVIAPLDFKASARQLDLVDLKDQRFLLREKGSGTRISIDDFLSSKRIKLPVRMTIGSNEAIKQGVAGGLGLAILSRHAISDADLRELRLLNVRDFPLPGEWHIVHSRNKQLSAAAHAFRIFLREHVRALRGSAR